MLAKGEKRLSETDAGAGPTFAILGLGSNVGEKQRNILRAVEGIRTLKSTQVVAVSRMFQTPPWGKTDQDWFVNACASVRTRLSPHDLLDACLGIERAMGRERREKWGPRVIDIDVLVYGDVEINDERLVVPHPLLTQRAFVLAPMADVAGDLVVNGKTVAQWLAAAPGDGIEVIEAN